MRAMGARAAVRGLLGERTMAVHSSRRVKVSSRTRSPTCSSATPSSSYHNHSIQDSDDLDLWGTSKELYERAGGVGGGGRVRQHINPFKKELQIPSELQASDWATFFEDPDLPLEVDVGCGSGRFLLARAKRNGKKSNFFGMDIRSKLVERSNKWAELLGLGSNLHYYTTNATVSFETVLRSYPGRVDFVSVQYPDPHFKKRHQKRRIVQDEFTAQVARVLGDSGKVFLQSDVREVLVDMRTRFERSAGFEHCEEEEIERMALESGALVGEKGAVRVMDDEGFVAINPTAVPTEREVHSSADGERVYRSLFRKLAAQP